MSKKLLYGSKLKKVSGGFKGMKCLANITAILQLKTHPITLKVLKVIFWINCSKKRRRFHLLDFINMKIFLKDTNTQEIIEANFQSINELHHQKKFMRLNLKLQAQETIKTKISNLIRSLLLLMR